MNYSLLRTSLAVLFAMFSLLVSAQMSSPVSFEIEHSQTSPDEVIVTYTATIEPGWHLYSAGMPEGGPQGIEFVDEVLEGAEPVDELEYIGEEIEEHDEMFGMTLRYFENEVIFVRKYIITEDTYNISGYLMYGTCGQGSCMPPTRVDYDFSGNTSECSEEDSECEEDSDYEEGEE